jgi:hypothetical protein
MKRSAKSHPPRLTPRIHGFPEARDVEEEEEENIPILNYDIVFVATGEDLSLAV